MAYTVTLVTESPGGNTAETHDYPTLEATRAAVTAALGSVGLIIVKAPTGVITHYRQRLATEAKR